jgi:hypothetical protein
MPTRKESVNQILKNVVFKQICMDDIMTELTTFRFHDLSVRITESSIKRNLQEAFDPPTFLSAEAKL